MKLYLDTSERDQITVGLGEKKYQTEAKQATSQRLLTFINEVLKKEGKTVYDISEIKVNTGPGSFTGLRVGVTVANTIGWVLKVPVNGFDLNKSEVADIIYN